MEIFYGIVTTTLVVLSSFTLAIFQFLATAIIKKAQDSHNRLSRYTNSENELTHQCDATAIYDLTAQYDRLKNSFKLLERNFEMEFILLLIVVFLSAVSIFLVLLQGIFKYEWISVKIIFYIDLPAIVVYMITFILFVFRLGKRNNEVKKHIKNIDDFLTRIKISDKILNDTNKS
jgi:hypothetical protein